MSNPEFTGFPKMGRIFRDCVITEKIDGTNAQIYITNYGDFLVGSRTRWIRPGDDNFGFAAWAHAHKDELMQLGPGRHFGEWWGQGIQRKYGLTEKRLSLFNTPRWEVDTLPPCVGLVPVLYQGLFSTDIVKECMDELRAEGSKAAPGFMDPEGVICYHVAAGVAFKATLDSDHLPKSLA
jgi:hypothetical protein